MIDTKQQNHDLAIAAAAISAYKNFDKEVYGDTPSSKRSAFADYLKEEYEFFLKYYTVNS